jgi:carbon-monoxide dehydrogenase medium subunit
LLPPKFDYVVPKSVSEAVDLLRSRGEGAKVIAGGQSLIPLLKLRLASPTVLVDIGMIPGLNGIRESDGFLRMGAMTPMADVAGSSLIQTKYPIIHDVSKVIADPLVRNRGTVGGNVSHGDPANDLPAVMLALDAEFAVQGPSGQRIVRAREFFMDTFTVALGHEDILTELRVPLPAPRSGGSYMKVEQKVADYATAGVAVSVQLGTKGEFETVGVGLTNVGPKAIWAKGAEDALVGRRPTEKGILEKAGSLAADASTPTTDIRGTAEYKRGLVKLLVARATRIAYRRARSGGAR